MKPIRMSKPGVTKFERLTAAARRKAAFEKMVKARAMKR
jgi:hypothetical protein